MIQSAVTLSLIPEARGGPFVFWDSLADGCARAAAHGFDAVEIFPPAANAVNADELTTLLSQHRLQLAAIGSGGGWVKYKLRLTDPDAAIRRQAVVFISALIELAATFRAPVIIGSMQGRWDAPVTRDQALAWLAEGLEELGAHAAQYGTHLLYEPLNRYETNLFNRVVEAKDFITSLRAQNVLLLCDLFHMNIEEPDIATALWLAGDRLGHVHFVDSNRHAPGCGHTDFAPVARTLTEMNYQGYASAEVLPLPDGESAAKQFITSFRRWFPHPTA